MDNEEAAATQSRNRGRIRFVRSQKLEEGLQGKELGSWLLRSGAA